MNETIPSVGEPETTMKKKLKSDSSLRAAACSPSYYTFRNKDGQTIQLRGDLTMEDLVRMGYTNIGLSKPETPLKPHEWRADTKFITAKP
jgi:hypothetical protein